MTEKLFTWTLNLNKNKIKTNIRSFIRQRSKSDSTTLACPKCTFFSLSHVANDIVLCFYKLPGPLRPDGDLDGVKS